MKTLWNKLLRPGSDALPGMRPLTDSSPSQPQRTPTAPSAGVLQQVRAYALTLALCAHALSLSAQGSPAPQSHLASVISNVMSPRAATRQPAAAAASTFDTDEWKQTQQTRAVYSWQPPALPPLPVATADFSEYGYGGAKYMAAAVRGGPGAAAPPPPKRSKLEAPPPPLPLALDLLLPAQADIDDAFDETFESQADGVWLGARGWRGCDWALTHATRRRPPRLPPHAARQGEEARPRAAAPARADRPAQPGPAL